MTEATTVHSSTTITRWKADHVIINMNSLFLIKKRIFAMPLLRCYFAVACWWMCNKNFIAVTTRATSIALTPHTGDESKFRCKNLYLLTASKLRTSFHYNLLSWNQNSSTLRLLQFACFIFAFLFCCRRCCFLCNFSLSLSIQTKQHESRIFFRTKNCFHLFFVFPIYLPDFRQQAMQHPIKWILCLYDVRVCARAYADSL